MGINDINKLTVKDMISLNHQVIEVFRKYNLQEIDDSLELKEVGEMTKLNEAFFGELMTMFVADDDYFPAEELKKTPINMVVDYLQKTHTHFLSKRLPEIEQIVIQLKGRIDDKSYKMLIRSVSTLRFEMTEHINLEEQQLFPYIENLINEKQDSSFDIETFEHGHDDNIEQKIIGVCLHLVHDFEEELLSVKVLTQMLNALEKDLKIHARIENEVLVPMTKELKNK